MLVIRVWNSGWYSNTDAEDTILTFRPEFTLVLILWEFLRKRRIFTYISWWNHHWDKIWFTNLENQAETVSYGNFFELILSSFLRNSWDFHLQDLQLKNITWNHIRNKKKAHISSDDYKAYCLHISTRFY